MKINERCQCGSSIEFDSEFDKKKHLHNWREEHHEHGTIFEPRVKGVDSNMSGPAQRRYEGPATYHQTRPIVFGFVRNELNE